MISTSHIPATARAVCGRVTAPCRSSCCLAASTVAAAQARATTAVRRACTGNGRRATPPHNCAHHHRSICAHACILLTGRPAAPRRAWRRAENSLAAAARRTWPSCSCTRTIFGRAMRTSSRPGPACTCTRHLHGPCCSRRHFGGPDQRCAYRQYRRVCVPNVVFARAPSPQPHPNHQHDIDTVVRAYIYM